MYGKVRCASTCNLSGPKKLTRDSRLSDLLVNSRRSESPRESFSCGCVMLGAGILVADRLADGSGRLFLHPARFGVSIALLGLGINQAAAPLRTILSKPE